MNLPIAVDIAIGLFFIYLIASLLASEIQELISTLLQWRAKHLKESITNLLSGGQRTEEADKLAEFVENLYEDPLIKNINQGAVGFVGFLGQLVYKFFYFFQKKTFGKRATGPSYIAPETFSTTLLEQLGIPLLLEKLTEIRLAKFANRLVGHYNVENGVVSVPSSDDFSNRDNREKGSLRVLVERAKALGADEKNSPSDNPIFDLGTDPTFYALVEDYEDILKDYQAKEVTLSIAIQRMQESLDNYIRQISIQPFNETGEANSEIQAASNASKLEQRRLVFFRKRLEALLLNTFGKENERAVLSGKLRPSLQEIAQVFDLSSSVYLELSSAYRDVTAAYEAGRSPETLPPLVKQIIEKNRAIASGEQPNLQISEIATNSPMASEVQTFNLLDADRQEGTQGEAIELMESVNEGRATPAQLPDLEQLSPAEREAFEGWQTYDRIIVRATRDIAQYLQAQGRLFNAKREEVTQPVSELELSTLFACVNASLRLASNEERRLATNSAIANLSADERRFFQNYQSYEELQKILQKVPNSVKQSLAILARRAQSKVHQVDNQAEQLTQEVALWFDRSMSRASGVYKRNAKGVAILIGFLIALLSNADTFHIVSRLADDDDLRQVISQRAGQTLQRSPNTASPTQAEARLLTREDLRDLKREVDAVLKETSLPIQWKPSNLREQLQCPEAETRSTADRSGIRARDLNDWRTFYQDCLPNQSTKAQSFDLLNVGQVATKHPIAAGRLLLGWIVSGIAISMGAPFWFDLLSKVMNVRNTGAKPAPVAEKEPRTPTV